MTVYVCAESFEGILCGVYDAWMSRKGHEDVRLELEGIRNMELFCTYEAVEADRTKAEKVASSIRQKLSEQVYEQVYLASLSQNPERAERIYRFWWMLFGLGVRFWRCCTCRRFLACLNFAGLWNMKTIS